MQEAVAEPSLPVGVVLAGGQSRRMGQDKTALSLPWLEGRTLLAWAAERMGKVCPEWVVADGGRGLLGNGVSLPDGPGAGPVAGILGAARRFPGRTLLVLACDLPWVPVALLQRLIGVPGDWVVPAGTHGPEPLCALYGPPALDVLDERVAAGRLSLRSLGREHPTLETRRIALKELVLPGRESWSPELFFVNANRPSDLEVLQSLEAFMSAEGEGNTNFLEFLRLHSTKG